MSSMEGWSGREDANASVRAVMMEARAARTKAVAQEEEERVRTRGGEVMGELASLRETLAPFRGRDEVDQLQTELARLRESAQEAARRIAEAGNARTTTLTGRDRPQQSTLSHAAGTAEHEREGEGSLQRTNLEDGLSDELGHGEEDVRVEPLMVSRGAYADAVRVLAEEDKESRTRGGHTAGSQHPRQQQQQQQQQQEEEEEGGEEQQQQQQQQQRQGGGGEEEEEEEEEEQQQQQQQQREGEEREGQREQEKGSQRIPSDGGDPGTYAVGRSPKDQKAKLQEDLNRLRQLSARIKNVPSRTGPGSGGPTAKRELDTMLSDIKSQLRGLASPGKPAASPTSTNGEPSNQFSGARAAVQDDLARLRKQLESVRSPPKSEGGQETVMVIKEGGGRETEGCSEDEIVREVDGEVGKGEEEANRGELRDMPPTLQSPLNLPKVNDGSCSSSERVSGRRSGSKPTSRRHSTSGGSLEKDVRSISDDCNQQEISKSRKNSLAASLGVTRAESDGAFFRNEVNESVLTIAFREFSGIESLGIQGLADIKVGTESGADSSSVVMHTATRDCEEAETGIEGLGLFKSWLVAGPCGLFYSIRTLVSGKKYRFQEDGFDLDLTYVTPNLIAMAYPAERTLVERASRNHIDEVLTFFKKKHLGKCKIFNLIKETNIARYDLQRFQNEGFPVTREYCFYDHSVPPIDILVDAVDEMNRWIRGGDQRVAAVHCKAGKGRTGLLVCCYLADVKKMKAEEAMLEYGSKRMKDGKGLTVPSQRRWVRYYVSRNLPVRTCNLKITSVSFKEGIFGKMYGQYKLMVHVHTSAVDVVGGETKRTWALALAFCSDTVSPNESGDIVFMPFENSVESGALAENGVTSKQLEGDRSPTRPGESNRGLVVDGGFCITICMKPRGKFVHGPSCWLHARHLPETVFLTTAEWDRVTQSNGIKNSDIHPKTSSSACAWEVKICSEPTKQSIIIPPTL